MNILHAGSNVLSIAKQGQSETGESRLVWTLTILFIVGLLAFDFFITVRKPHEPSIKESALWTVFYTLVAVGFGVFLLLSAGSQKGAEFFAGYVTERALSIDNLFVFIIILASFKVPRKDQQKVLLFGIIFALIARSLFIFLGAALIERFAWIFYIFGIILLWTALSMIKKKEESQETENFIVRGSRRLFKTSENYNGDKLFTIKNGKKVLTPMILVIIAIGGTDVLFALDSIPATFGLTQDSYIVFTANAFSLLGMMHLYFLVDGLLEKLVYLHYGLAIILGFIGVKLILHALHENNLPFINGGNPVPVPEIGTGVSLIFIVAVLVVTVVASLTLGKKKKEES